MSPQRPLPGFSPDALRQLRRFTARRQRRVVDSIRAQLVLGDPLAGTRNKFRLRRASAYADFELRVDDMRVFYRVTREGVVLITLIGRKLGSRLVVEGKEFQL